MSALSGRSGPSHCRKRTIVVTADCESRFAAFRGAQVLITGGVGLIGSALARRLVGLGAEVLLVDSMVPEAGANLANIADIRDRVAAQHRRYPRRRGDAPSAGRPGFPVRSRRPDQPSQLDERAGTRPRGQLHRAIAAARIVPRGGAGDHDRARRHAPDLRPAALPAGRRGSTRCARPTSTASTRWPARPITCCFTTSTASTPARCG